MRLGVQFFVPDVITAIESEDVGTLTSELHEIGWPIPRRPDILDLHSAILNHQTALNQPRRTFHPDEPQRALLLRATDHLRNLGHRGELLELRTRLINAALAGSTIGSSSWTVHPPETSRATHGTTTFTTAS